MVELRGEADGDEGTTDLFVSHIVVDMDSLRIIGRLTCPGNVPFGASLVSVAGIRDDRSEEGSLWAVWWWNSSSMRIIDRENEVTVSTKERNCTRYGAWGITSHSLVRIYILKANVTRLG